MTDGDQAAAVEMEAQRWSVSQPEPETSARAVQPRMRVSRPGKRPA